jgi:hypothetical protein
VLQNTIEEQWKTFAQFDDYRIIDPKPTNWLYVGMRRMTHADLRNAFYGLREAA